MKTVFLMLLLMPALVLASGKSTQTRKVASADSSILAFMGNRVTDLQISFRAADLHEQAKMKPVLSLLIDTYGKMQADMISGRNIEAYVCNDELQKAFNIYSYNNKVRSLLNQRNISDSERKALSTLLHDSEKALDQKNIEHVSCLKQKSAEEVKVERIDVNGLKSELESLKK